MKAGARDMTSGPKRSEHIRRTRTIVTGLATACAFLATLGLTWAGPDAPLEVPLVSLAGHLRHSREGGKGQVAELQHDLEECRGEVTEIKEEDFRTKLLETGWKSNDNLRVLSKISDSPVHLERTFLSPASLRALALVRNWMDDAGLRTWLDSVGNLHGRWDGAEGEAVLMLGSHIDTVIDGGAYDGTLGIVTAVNAVSSLKLEAERLGGKLRRSVEVVAFSDEEGVRFKSTFLGSRALSGSFLKHGYLNATDDKGYKLSSVLQNVGLSNSEDSISQIAMKPEEIYGYVEVHIEQGPVLESLNQPLGVVSAISGQTRLYVQVHGTQGHAGTVPMNQRRDSSAAAAAIIHDIESRCRSHPRAEQDMLVCTVGEFNIFPGASNVIPGYANFSIDVRCKQDGVRDEVVEQISLAIGEECDARGVGCFVETKHTAGSCEASSQFVAGLADSIVQTRDFLSGFNTDKFDWWELDAHKVPIIPSGAGHDALALSEVAPIGMLFVRCRDGVSHSPLEFVEETDVEIATLSLYHFLRSELLVEE